MWPNDLAAIFPIHLPEFQVWNSVLFETIRKYSVFLFPALKSTDTVILFFAKEFFILKQDLLRSYVSCRYQFRRFLHCIKWNKEPFVRCPWKILHLCLPLEKPNEHYWPIHSTHWHVEVSTRSSNEITTLNSVLTKLHFPHLLYQEIKKKKTLLEHLTKLSFKNFIMVSGILYHFWK